MISTANYPARKFGVRSAMPTATALKLCPHLTLLPGRFDAYKEASNHIREIFSRYTSRIEPLSLDEAYLDVSDSEHCHGSATLIAQEIRQTIERELRLTASAGVAPVKFLAKIASDMNKPNGPVRYRSPSGGRVCAGAAAGENTRRREGIGSEAGKYGPANLWRCAKQRSGHAA
ncbi:DNA polymerase IV [Klebsiella pneumoniae]|uniref:DNA polymerase IV n=1 Tax=Klebsiella pneumoniae TaxID=573 RepID=A0A2X3GBY1_KLEPN|nr:DNA polymerase IV [Klebsiella pneumoniae]